MTLKGIRQARARPRGSSRSRRRWVKDVVTDSTAIPPGLFTRDPVTIARTLSSPRVSPKGPVSGLRMLSFFINRAGRQLTSARRTELERAKRLMQRAIAARRGGR